MSYQKCLAQTALILVSAGLISCSTAEEHGAHADSAAWGYEGDIGPAHWGDLSPEYTLANTGQRQSPIDIRDVAAGDLPAIRYDYQMAPINLVHNGHTIEHKIGSGHSIEVDGRRYTLKQFHFHSPSENTVNGGHADMEMHLVHANDQGELAVVAVLINEGSENQAYAAIWDNLPTPQNPVRTLPDTVDVDRLLPPERAYFRFQGSLTTPPCSEGVVWLVLQEPVELSGSQVAQFRAIVHDNNRPVQPLNGRTVDRSN